MFLHRQDGLGVNVNGKDDEDLEWMEALEWGLVGIPGSKVGGKLDKATILQLGGVQTGRRSCRSKE